MNVVGYIKRRRLVGLWETTEFPGLQHKGSVRRSDAERGGRFDPFRQTKGLEDTIA